MTFRHRRATAAAFILTSIAAIACGGSEDEPRGATASPATLAATTVANAPASDGPASTAAPPTTEAPPPTTTAGPTWHDDATAICEHWGRGSPPAPDGSPASVVEWVAAIRRLSDTAPALDMVAVEAESPVDAARLTELAAQAEEQLAAAETAAAAGDVEAAYGAIDQHGNVSSQTGAVYILAGASCAGFDASRAAGASLNVPLADFPNQLEVAFDSVWVSARDGTKVTRIDTDTGEILATIAVPLAPAKLQAADGRMWVRTADSYVAIDPASNTVNATLTKADVGPAADRSWAVDGAMWICDGQLLHRYDPTTLQRVATVELGIDCGQVYATTDLVVAWTYNQDAGESGTSAAVFVDPATNQVMATVPLPVDVGVPVVLDDAVFFSGYLGSKAVVVDRDTWTVVATPDLGRPTETSQNAFDGNAIYVPTVDSQTDPVNGRPDVLVVDPTTFTVTDTIETLGANSTDAADGALWVVDTAFGIVQRFDRDR